MTITVYAASGSLVPPVYFQAAKELGKLLAQNNITCINGAGNTGLMAAVSDAVLENGGKVIGIIPEFMVAKGWVHDSLTERIITPDIHSRKQLMAKKADACIALPGGFGTMEELLEIITWKQLELFSKPIVILNIHHFYDDLIQLLQKAGREKFVSPEDLSLWSVAETPEEALRLLA
ncbi:MAG: TIGR00730 family Rossman fold protein [Candidatus Symbiothrix sp.]|jgi:uncharacterized protein (TIGR00730 family)|nr:TIGR00730 family Rossman fold protein [Candidatus Symbiothrix sp.]